MATFSTKYIVYIALLLQVKSVIMYMRACIFVIFLFSTKQLYKTKIILSGPPG